MRLNQKIFTVLILISFFSACSTGGDVVRVTTITGGRIKGLDEGELAKLEEIKEIRKQNQDNNKIKQVLQNTPNYTVQEYFSAYPDAANQNLHDYRIGGYDVLDIIVYEEKDLTREGVRVSADGYISFPLIGRIEVDGLATSEVEKLISDKLASGQYILDAHVSVTVMEYKSKQFLALGAVKEPGSYPLEAKERVLDAISRAEGIDFDQGGERGMIIRTLNPDTEKEKKIVIRIDLPGLLKTGDQFSNLLLMDKDLLYIPKAEHFYIFGQVKRPGSYLYKEQEITIVEAISMAGGFTPIAARNRTRIIRVEDDVEKIIQVKIDAITEAGQKFYDIKIFPGDVIVVPESFF